MLLTKPSEFFIPKSILMSVVKNIWWVYIIFTILFQNQVNWIFLEFFSSRNLKASCYKHILSLTKSFPKDFRCASFKTLHIRKLILSLTKRFPKNFSCASSKAFCWQALRTIYLDIVFQFSAFEFWINSLLIIQLVRPVKITRGSFMPSYR